MSVGNCQHYLLLNIDILNTMILLNNTRLFRANKNEMININDETYNNKGPDSNVNLPVISTKNAFMLKPNLKPLNKLTTNKILIK